MKKKVLIVAESLGIGGIERSLINMLNSFDYKKYKVDLMLYSQSGELLNSLNSNVTLLKSPKGCELFGIPIVDVFKKGNFKIGIGRSLAKLKSIYVQSKFKIEGIGYYQGQFAYKYTHRFLETIDNEYDLVIGYTWPFNYLIEKVKAKKKIGWIHTDYSTIYIDRKIDKNMWQKMDYIASISEECTKALLKVYPDLKEKMVLVENITSSKFIIDKSKERIYEDLDEKCFNLLSIGRLCEAKGFDRAVEVLKIIHRKGYKDIKWNIIGFGPDDEKIKKIIEKNNLKDSFILLGKKINPYPYLKKCDIYVQPSRYEGKAVTINEAKILGKPIIITNYETAKSQLKDGFDGYICGMEITDIANKIIELYKDKATRDKFKKNCLAQNYDNKEELEKLYEVIK